MRNRYLEAFKENFNVVGLTGAVALSAALLNPVPLLLSLVAEAAYLIFVPDSKWYEHRLSRLNDADILKRRDDLKRQAMPLLRPTMQARYLQLEDVRAKMETPQASPVEGQNWFREVLRKLDFLLEKFLQFAVREAQFRKYLEDVLHECRISAGRGVPANDPSVAANAARMNAMRHNATNARGRGLAGALPPNGAPQLSSVPNPPAPRSNQGIDANEKWAREAVEEAQKYYDLEIAGLQQTHDGESDPNTQAVLQKRLEVLQRRREFAGKIGRILTNLHHQLHLLEETFGLISDEMLARPPEQVLADIDDVVSQTNTMTQVLEEVAPYEQMLQRMSA